GRRSTTSRTSTPRSGSPPALGPRCSRWSTACWRKLGRSAHVMASPRDEGGGMALTTGSAAPARESSGERLFTSAFVLLSVADLAYFTAAGVAIYTLPSYVTGPVGSGKAGAGLAFGAFAVT